MGKYSQWKLIYLPKTGTGQGVTSPVKNAGQDKLENWTVTNTDLFVISRTETEISRAADFQHGIVLQI